MKTQRTFLAATALAATCILNLSALGQGALTPPGAPAPTMKSLDQIEARTAITNTSSLVTISQPGSYYLTHNLTVSSGDAIDITTNGVTLDLNGFTIVSTASSANGTAIYLNNPAAGNTDIIILNGHILGGVTNNGSGVYSGVGFANGINNYKGAAENILVSRITVSGCLYYGIYLNLNNTTSVEACTVRTVGADGINASTIKGCVVTDCGGNAIYCYQVSDSRGQCSGGSYGVNATSAQNSLGQSNSGVGLLASTAQNCYGYSNSDDSLHAYVAENCEGFSSNGTGLNAIRTATGCYGNSISGLGLSAFIANCCSGSSLSVTHNVNSF